MSSQRGAGLLDCLVGLALGLLVLQGLADALASAQRGAQAQRDALRTREAHDIARQMLQAVACAGPRVHSAGGVDTLHARFAEPAAAGSCGGAPGPEGTTHAYHLWLDDTGTLHGAADGHVPQPLADGLAAWRFELLQVSGPPEAPRLRLSGAAQVRDWQRVVLLRTEVRDAARGSSPQVHWLALPRLDAPLARR